MNKVLVIISALALSLSVANAQQSGPGDGVQDGSGPRGNMWQAITDAAEGNETISTAIGAIRDARTALAAERAKEENKDLTIDEFRAKYPDQIAALRTNMETVQSWWREVRPDRPDPVLTGEMLQRRLQFRTNTQNITQARRQLRQMDPSDEGYAEARQQLRQSLGERKQLLRDQRRGEGGPGGEGGSGRGPGG